MLLFRKVVSGLAVLGLMVSSGSANPPYCGNSYVQRGAYAPAVQTYKSSYHEDEVVSEISVLQVFTYQYIPLPVVQTQSTAGVQSPQAQVGVVAPNQQAPPTVDVDMPPVGAYDGDSESTTSPPGGRPGIALMQARCASCHGDSRQSGGVRLFTGQNFTGQDHLEEALIAIKTGHMPPGRPLEQSDRALVRKDLLR